MAVETPNGGATPGVFRTGWASAGRRRPLWQTAILHLVLVALSATFLMPLFWLLSSSLKTDDQIRAFPPEWLPDIPYYSTRSPYIDAYHYDPPSRPDTCPPETWDKVKDRLPTEAWKAVAVLMKSDAYAQDLPSAEMAALARGTFVETLAAIPAKTFSRGVEAVMAAAQANMPSAAEKALEMSRRWLGIGAVTFQLEETGMRETSKTFETLTWWPPNGSARIESSSVIGVQEGVLVSYEQPARRGRKCRTVRAVLDWTPVLDDFRSLTIRLHGDRSWRKIDIRLATPHGSFRSERPILLSSAGWTDLILIREPEGEIPWGTYRLVRASTEEYAARNAALLSMEILPASRLQVILRKLWHNYPSGLTFIPFARYLFNTLLICVLVVLGTLISCSLVAYGLARIRWRGRHALFYVIIATMMLPFQVTMVPLFVVFARLGWVDTFLPLFVPAFFGNAFFIFLLRQFFLTIPPELTDAARIDGCSELDIYWRVVLPLAKPALATVGLFAFMNTWNDYVGPLIYLSDASKYTLSLGLATFSSQYGSYPGMLMAVTAVMTLPIIALFFLAQRTFIQGITLTGLKG